MFELKIVFKNIKLSVKEVGGINIYGIEECKYNTCNELLIHLGQYNISLERKKK